MTFNGVLFNIVGWVGLLLLLTPLVLIHELGHFVVARLSNIKVLEFGLGFPPRAKVIGHDHETEYTINYLPIGGFVRLEGEETDSDDPRSFTNAPLKRQIAVMVAGVTMNLLTAVFLLFVVAWAFNPTVQPSITNDPNDMNTPARAAGMHDGDTLISIDGQPFSRPSVLDFSTNDPYNSWRALILDHAGKTVQIVVADQNGTQRTLTVTPRVPQANQGALGVILNSSISTSTGNPVTAFGQAVTGTGKAMTLIFSALGDVVNRIATNPGAGPQGVQGPAGMATDIAGVVSQPNAFMLLLLMAAIISANLALLNVMPFPPLDGGKLVIMVVKRVFGLKGVSAVEAAIYMAGFVLLFAFIGWVTYFDIIKGGKP